MSAAAILKLAQLQEVYNSLAATLTSPSGLSPHKQHMMVSIQKLKTAMQLAAQVNALLQMVSTSNITCDQVNTFVPEDQLDQRRAFCGTLLVDGKKKCVMKDKVCRPADGAAVVLEVTRVAEAPGEPGAVIAEEVIAVAPAPETPAPAAPEPAVPAPALPMEPALVAAVIAPQPTKMPPEPMPQPVLPPTPPPAPIMVPEAPVEPAMAEAAPVLPATVDLTALRKDLQASLGAAEGAASFEALEDYGNVEGSLTGAYLVYRHMLKFNTLDDAQRAIELVGKLHKSGLDDEAVERVFNKIQEAHNTNVTDFDDFVKMAQLGEMKPAQWDLINKLFPLIPSSWHNTAEEFDLLERQLRSVRFGGMQMYKRVREIMKTLKDYVVKGVCGVTGFACVPLDIRTVHQLILFNRIRFYGANEKDAWIQKKVTPLLEELVSLLSASDITTPIMPTTVIDSALAAGLSKYAAEKEAAVAELSTEPLLELSYGGKGEKVAEVIQAAIQSFRAMVQEGAALNQQVIEQQQRIARFDRAVDDYAMQKIGVEFNLKGGVWAATGEPGKKLIETQQAVASAIENATAYYTSLRETQLSAQQFVTITRAIALLEGRAIKDIVKHKLAGGQVDPADLSSFVDVSALNASVPNFMGTGELDPSFWTSADMGMGLVPPGYQFEGEAAPQFGVVPPGYKFDEASEAAGELPAPAYELPAPELAPSAAALAAPEVPLQIAPPAYELPAPEVPLQIAPPAYDLPAPEPVPGVPALPAPGVPLMIAPPLAAAPVGDAQPLLAPPPEMAGQPAQDISVAAMVAPVATLFLARKLYQFYKRRSSVKQAAQQEVTEQNVAQQLFTELDSAVKMYKINVKLTNELRKQLVDDLKSNAVDDLVDIPAAAARFTAQMSKVQDLLDASGVDKEFKLETLKLNAVLNFLDFAEKKIEEMQVLKQTSEDPAERAFYSSMFYRLLPYMSSKKDEYVQGITDAIQASEGKSSAKAMEDIRTAVDDAMHSFSAFVTRYEEMLHAKAMDLKGKSLLVRVYERIAGKAGLNAQQFLGMQDVVELIQLEPADLAPLESVPCNAINSKFPVTEVAPGVFDSVDVTRRREMCMAMLKDGKPKCHFYEPKARCISIKTYDVLVKAAAKRLEKAAKQGVEEQSAAYGEALAAIVMPTVGAEVAVELGKQLAGIETMQDVLKMMELSKDKQDQLDEALKTLKQQVDGKVQELTGIEDATSKDMQQLVADVKRTTLTAAAKYALKSVASKVASIIKAPFRWAYRNPLKTALIVAVLIKLFLVGQVDESLYTQFQNVIPGLDSLSYDNLNQFAQTSTDALIKFYDALTLDNILKSGEFARHNAALLYNQAQAYLQGAFSALSGLFNLQSLNVTGTAATAANLATQAGVTGSTAVAVSANTGAVAIPAIYSAVGPALAGVALAAPMLAGPTPPLALPAPAWPQGKYSYEYMKMAPYEGAAASGQVALYEGAAAAEAAPEQLQIAPPELASQEFIQRAVTQAAGIGPIQP